MAENNDVKFSILVRDQLSAVMNKARNSIKSAAVAAKEMDKQQRTFAVNFKDHYSLYNKYQSDLASGKVKREWARTVDELKAANLQIKNAQVGLKKMESLPPDSFLQRLSKATETLTGLRFKDFGMVWAARQVRKLVNESIELYKIQDSAEAQLRASLEATRGVAGKTFEELKKQAAEMQKVSPFKDEKIIAAQARMLTFKNIRGDMFDKAMQVAADIAAKKKIDLETAVDVVAKGINSPDKHLNTLFRSGGIEFSENQVEKIEKLVAAGKEQEAQMLILTELNERYAGSAAAASTPLLQLQMMWADMKERIGAIVVNFTNAFIPALKSAVEWLQRNGNAMLNVAKAMVVAGASLAVYKAVTAGAALASKTFYGALTLKTFKFKLLASAIRIASATMVFFKALTPAGWAGIALAGVTALVSAFFLFRKKAKETAVTMNEVSKAASSYYAQERAQLDVLFAKLKATNPKSAERKRLVKELAAAYPELNKQTLDEITNTNKLSGAYDQLIAKIKLRAKAKAIEDVINQEYAKDTVLDDIIERRVKANPKEYSENGSFNMGKGGYYGDPTRKTDGEMAFSYTTTDGNIAFVSVGQVRKYHAKQKRINSLTASLAGINLGESTGSSTSPTFDTQDASEKIASGGKSVRNFYITIGSLIGENTNQFNSSSDNPSTANGFMDELTRALQGVVNDVNYAAD